MFSFEDRLGEILIIGALALIVIGPKDLPVAMRRLGQFIGKLRSMAAEFRASFDELARQSELEELRKEVEALRNSHTSVVNAINPLADPALTSTMDSINQQLGETSFAPMMSSQAVPSPIETSAAAEAAPPETVEPPAKPKAPRKSRAKSKPAPVETDPAADAASPTS